MTVIDAAQWPPRDEPGGQHMPSPFLPERLKALRTEAGWSQAELAAKIDSDGRRVSRYANGRITPSLEALVRIAETFNVSVDHLVVDDAPAARCSHRTTPWPTCAPTPPWTPTTGRALLKVLDALVMKHKLQALTGGAG